MTAPRFADGVTLASSRALAFAAAAALAACASPTTRVVLLPQPDGSPSAITVTTGDGERVVLDKPYAAVEIGRGGPRTYSAESGDSRRGFDAALAARPPKPAKFVLHFVENSDELTPPSKQAFEDALAELARHPAADIVVVGHTDALGSDATNDALALKRAQTVRASILGRGIAADSVSAVGRGKRELLVPTSDGVAEPRNRRVEILVR